ncbi:MAG: alpha-amylase, partial [Catenulispora sp.]|nr:alpha-amylase [Catenulispora sp.]
APSGQVAETFSVAGAPAGAPVYLVGSLPALGNWSPAAAIPLVQNSSTWSGTVNLPAGTAFQYKYLTKDASGNVTWELDPNHSASTGSAGATLNDTWHGASSAVSASFNATVTTWYGQNVYVVGSVPALGSWNVANAVPLSSANYPVWRATVTLPPNTAFEYKYIKKDPDGSIEWESGSNRTASSGTGATLTLNDTWK